MNPTLKQLAGEVRDGRDDQVAQPLAARHDLLRQLDLWVARGWLRALTGRSSPSSSSCSRRPIPGCCWRRR